MRLSFRALHIGDVHLQSGHPRNADRLSSLDQIIAYGLGLDDLGVWLVPGDLFHTKPTTQDRNDLASRLIVMGQKAPVVMVPGNHDELGSLDIFGKLDTEWGIVVVSRPQLVRIDLPIHGLELAVFCLPYPFKSSMVSAGVEHQLLASTTEALFEPIFLKASDDLARCVAVGCVPMMIGHVSVCGAIASTGQPQIGSELELSTALLARLMDRWIGEPYQGLNHIHKHQAVGTAVYAGSIARLDFSEREPKGFVEVQYRKDGTRWGHQWQFVPLAVPEMVHVEGRLTREAFTIESVDGDHVSEGPDDSGRVLTGGEFVGVDVRCRYRFVKAEVGALDVAKVHAEFAGCRSLQLDPIAEREHVVRAPEIVAAVSLEDKVEACAVRQGVAVTDGLRRKLSDLQALPSERLLAGVSERLAQVGVIGGRA